MPRYTKQQKIEYAKKDLQLKLNHEGRLAVNIKRPLFSLYRLICCQDYKQYPDVKDNPSWGIIRTQIINVLKQHYRQVGKTFAQFQTKDMGFEVKDVFVVGSEVDPLTQNLFNRMAERQADIIMGNSINMEERDRNSVIAAILARYARGYLDEIDLRSLAYEDAVVLLAFLRKLSNRANLIGLVETRNSAEIAKLITSLRVRQVAIAQERGEITESESEADIYSAEHEGASLEALIAFYAGAAVVGFTAKKQWNAILDNRTRPAHAEADGQVVAVDEDFIVDGEPLMYPGDDSRASIGNTINCRCTAMYYYE